jgi:hypothetical protein
LVFVSELPRELVLPIMARIADTFVRFGYQEPRFRTVARPFLLAREVALLAREMEQLTERERLFIAVMTRSVSALLGNIFAGFGEMANPLRIERMLEAHVMEEVKAAFDGKEIARRGF